MGRAPCCEKETVKRGPWTPEEDAKLLACVSQYGTGSWRTLPKKAGLQRCGKSCRLRWTNYLRPDLKHGRFSEHEEQLIVKLHAALGSRWSLIAAQLPGRTDNDVKNYWNTRLKKKLCEMGIDPITHKPISQLLADLAGSMTLQKGSEIAEATLGCFKDDMLNVLMRKRFDDDNNNYNNNNNNNNVIMGHNQYQTNQTQTQSGSQNQAIGTPHSTNTTSNNMVSLDINTHAHLMNNIYNHNSASSNHRVINASTGPVHSTMSFAPLKDHHDHENSASLLHNSIKHEIKSSGTISYNRRRSISGANPCGPVSGIRSAQGRCNVRSTNTTNEDTLNQSKLVTSHNNRVPNDHTNYGGNASLTLFNRSTNDITMDDFNNLDYGNYNLNTEMMQNLMGTSSLMNNINNGSAHDYIMDESSNGHEHVINGTFDANVIHGSFNTHDHVITSPDGKAVPDLNLMNEGSVHMHMEHPNLYTLLMKQHFDVEMMKNKNKNIVSNSGSNTTTLEQAAHTINTHATHAITHSDNIIGNEPTSTGVCRENFKVDDGHSCAHNIIDHNADRGAFTNISRGPSVPISTASARCEWSPSSYTNSGSSSSNLSLCNNNDNNVNNDDTSNIPKLVPNHSDQQITNIISPLDGLLWELCELGSMVS